MWQPLPLGVVRLDRQMNLNIVADEEPTRFECGVPG